MKTTYIFSTLNNGLGIRPRGRIEVHNEELAPELTFILHERREYFGYNPNTKESTERYRKNINDLYVMITGELDKMGYITKEVFDTQNNITMRKVMLEGRDKNEDTK